MNSDSIQASLIITRPSILLHGDRLGQVTWEVDVHALSNSQPVGHELKRDDVEQTLEDINSVGNLDSVGLLARELVVASVANDDWAALSGNDLLVCVEGLGEDVVAGEDHDDGKVLIDESEHTMLQLTGHDGFAVKVGNLLDLESA